MFEMPELPSQTYVWLVIPAYGTLQTFTVRSVPNSDL